MKTNSQTEVNQAESLNGASYVVADIGGTNARLAIYTPDGSGTIQHDDQLRFRCSEFKSLSEVLKAYLEQTGRNVEGACVSIAAPADGDRIKMTNLDWYFSINDYKQVLGLKTLLVINDGVAWPSAAGAFGNRSASSRLPANTSSMQEHSVLTISRLACSSLPPML